MSNDIRKEIEKWTRIKVDVKKAIEEWTKRRSIER